MKDKKLSKRILSGILSVTMAVSALPAAVFADEVPVNENGYTENVPAGGEITPAEIPGGTVPVYSGDGLAEGAAVPVYDDTVAPYVGQLAYDMKGGLVIYEEVPAADIGNTAWETGVEAVIDLVPHGRIASPFLRAVGSLLGISTGPTISDAIDKINTLSKDVSEFRTEMNTRFNELNSRIDALDSELKKINNAMFQNSVKTELRTLNTQINGGVDEFGISRIGISGQINSILSNPKYNDDVKAIEIAVLIGKYDDWNRTDNVLYRFKNFAGLLSGASGAYKDEKGRDYFQVLYDTAASDCMFTGEVYDEMKPYVDLYIYEYLSAYTSITQCLAAALAVSNMTDAQVKAYAQQYGEEAIYSYYLQCKTIDSSLIKNELDTLTAMFLDANNPYSIISRYSVFQYKLQNDRLLMINKGTEQIQFSDEILIAERPWTDDRRVGDWSADFLNHTKAQDELISSQEKIGFPAKKINDYLKTKYSTMTLGNYLESMGFDISRLKGHNSSIPVAKFPYDSNPAYRVKNPYYPYYGWFGNGDHMISQEEATREAYEQNLYSCRRQDSKNYKSQYYYDYAFWIPQLPSVDPSAPASSAEGSAKIYIIHREWEFYSPIDGHKYQGVDKCLRMYFYDRLLGGLQTCERKKIPTTAAEAMTQSEEDKKIREEKIKNDPYNYVITLKANNPNTELYSSIFRTYIYDLSGLFSWEVTYKNGSKTSIAQSSLEWEVESYYGGVKINGNQVSFTFPGNPFRFRLKTTNHNGSTAYSNWADIYVTTDPFPIDPFPIGIMGNFTGTVGADPTLFETAGDEIEALNNSLIVAYPEDYDDRYTKWEAMESDGIYIDTAGLVTFTKPGTYHVRIVSEYGEALSDWKEITAVLPGNITPAPAASYSPSVPSNVPSSGSAPAPAAANKGSRRSPVDGKTISGKVTENCDIILTWDKVDKARSYTVYLVEGKKAKKLAVTKKNTYTYKGAQKGKTYRFMVKYTTKEGLSKASESYKVTVKVKGTSKVTAKRSSTL